MQCGIVNTGPMFYHNQLRHFAQTRSLTYDIGPLEHQNYELRAFERQAAEELLEVDDEVLGEDEDDLRNGDD